MLLRVGENVVWVSNSLDQDETPSYSVFHPDPSCLYNHYSTLVVLGGLRVKNQYQLELSYNTSYATIEKDIIFYI